MSRVAYCGWSLMNLLLCGSLMLGALAGPDQAQAEEWRYKTAGSNRASACSVCEQGLRQGPKPFRMVFRLMSARWSMSRPCTVSILGC